MSPILEQYARSLGNEPPPRRQQPTRKPRPRISFHPLHPRRCFICGTWGMCCHREPELLIAVVGESGC